MDYSELYVKRIRALCKKRGISINKLATMSGVKQSTLDMAHNNWIVLLTIRFDETGTNNCTGDAAKRLPCAKGAVSEAD